MEEQMQKQFKPTLTRKKLLIKNSKFYSYCIVNSKVLCKLNIEKGDKLLLLLMR